MQIIFAIVISFLCICGIRYKTYILKIYIHYTNTISAKYFSNLYQINFKLLINQLSATIHVSYASSSGP